MDGLIGADIAVEQERKGDDRGGQHHHGEDEADRVADDDQRPAAAGREDLVDEAGQRFRRGRAEQLLVEGLGGQQPGDEDDDRARPPTAAIDGSAGEFLTSKACHQDVSSPASRRRLIS